MQARWSAALQGIRHETKASGVRVTYGYIERLGHQGLRVSLRATLCAVLPLFVLLVYSLCVIQTMDHPLVHMISYIS